MTLPIRLTSAAERDLMLAELWYLEEAPHMLVALEGEVERVFGYVGEQPEMYKVVVGTVRRAPLERFPFSVFYCVLPEWIEVLGVGTPSPESRRVATSDLKDSEPLEDPLDSPTAPRVIARWWILEATARVRDG